METKSSKSVIMGVLILGLVIQQAQIEACRVCCCSTSERNCYNRCRFEGDSRETCAGLCACKILDKCVRPCDRFNLYPDADEAKVIEYCKLGCLSSLCNTITTFVGSEQENNVAENCKTGCYRVCTKDVDFAKNAS